MLRGGMAAAGVAALAITATAAAYIATGNVPDVLVAVTTTAVGGFLGMSVPAAAASPGSNSKR